MDLFRGALERLSGKQVVHKYTGGLSSELTAKIRPTTVDRIEVERLNMAQASRAPPWPLAFRPPVATLTCSC